MFDLLSGYLMARPSEHTKLVITVDMKKINQIKIKIMFTLLPECATLPLGQKEVTFFTVNIVSTGVHVYWFEKLILTCTTYRHEQSSLLMLIFDNVKNSLCKRQDQELHRATASIGSIKLRSWKRIQSCHKYSENT